MKIKRNTKTYFRSFYISLIILICLSLGWIGISSAYENTVQIAFGEHRDAIEIQDGKLRILDWVINKKITCQTK